MNIDTWEEAIPSLSPDLPRTIHITTPSYYEKDPDSAFPVLYMFDGQNILFDEEASFGKSWGMGAYLEEADPPLITVTISSNPRGNLRLEEYSPFDVDNDEYDHFHGLGAATIRYLVRSLKPRIDDAFRTLPDRYNTFICGSSMGGLISLYAGTHYSHVFGRACCLSPSLWMNPSASLNMIRHARISQDTVIYLDYGTEELDNHKDTRRLLPEAVRLLLRHNVAVTFRIIPGGSHCESSWEQQIPYFMATLGF